MAAASTLHGKLATRLPICRYLLSQSASTFCSDLVTEKGNSDAHHTAHAIRAQPMPRVVGVPVGFRSLKADDLLSASAHRQGTPRWSVSPSALAASSRCSPSTSTKRAPSALTRIGACRPAYQSVDFADDLSIRPGAGLREHHDQTIEIKRCVSRSVRAAASISAIRLARSAAS
jgi:hypothetical protein